MSVVIIHSLRLHNIRSYTDAFIEFPTGSIMLSGDIGTGKSTILLAIEFALFGLTSSVDGSTLLRNGRDFGEVELKLTIDRRIVLVKRGLKRLKDSVRQDEGYIVVDGKRQEGTPTELKARVLELLGYPKELLTKSKSLIFRYTVYTPQEEMKLILMDNNTNRLDTLRRVFNIDKYKRIRDNALFIIKSTKERIRELSARVEDLPQIGARKDGLEKELSGIDESIAQVTPKIVALEGLIESKKRHNEGLEEKSRQMYERKKLIEVLSARIRERKNSLKDAETELAGAGLETGELKKKNEEGKKLHDTFAGMLACSMKKKERLVEESGRKAILEKELEGLEEELGRASAEIRKQQYIVELSEKVAGSVSSLETCPTCRQPVSDEHKSHIITLEREKMEKAVALLSETSASKSRLELKISGLKKEICLLREKERQLAGISAEISMCLETAAEAGLQQKLHEKMQASSHLDAPDETELRRINRLIRESRQYEQLLEEREIRIKSLKEKAAALAVDIKGLVAGLELESSRMGEFGELEKQIREGRSGLDELLRNEKALSMQCASLNSRKDSLNREIGLISTEIAKKTGIKSEAEQLKRTAHWMDEHFISMMGLMEQQVMLKVYNEFNAFFQSWFSTLMEDNTLSIRLDEDFTPVIEQNGYEQVFESLSGGERTSCALSYRLALNRVINDLVSTIKTRNLLILDEPTEGFSSEQLERIRDVIAQLNTNQLIIVSHESKIESFVSSVIRIGKEEHVSRIVG
ncbi:SMC family ATPase [Candidatus Woesearchaeota archaeon]|nr:SMC family ATPase [Candidatus Woesearchaeota archaeon]